MKTLRLLAPVALAIVMAQSANASVIATLTFLDPTGTVTADESIDVWVRLSLDIESDPLTYDPFDSFPNGINFDDLPLEDDFGNQFEAYNFAFLFQTRSCNDTFTVGCSGAGSQYSYNLPTSDRWFDFEGTINPGESVDILLYTLNPTGGLAAPGFYELFTVGVGIAVEGEDEFGNVIEADIYRFTTNCPDANCTFSRTVTPVPLPAAVWLFGTALLGLFGVSRRR